MRVIHFLKKIKIFYKSKILRIIPVYYISLIVWYFLIKEGIAVKPYNVKDLIYHLLFIHTFDKTTFFSISGVFWYIGVQIHFYLLFPFIVILLEKINNILLFLASFIPLVLASIFFSKGDVVLYWNAMIFMPTFVAGILLYKGYMRIESKLFIVFIFICIFSIMNINNITLMLGMWDRVIAGILLGVLLFNLRDGINKLPFYIKNFVTLIAITSYSIYLYNYIVVSYIPIVKSGSGLVIYTMLVFGFGILMYELIEKPLTKIIKK